MTCFSVSEGENETLKYILSRILCYLCVYLLESGQIITIESKKGIWKQKKVRFLWSERRYNLRTSWFREKHRKTAFSQRAEKHESTHFFYRKTLWRVVFFEKNAFSDNSGIYSNDLCTVFWYFARFTHSCCLSGGMTVLMLEITIISSKFSGQIW